MLQNAYFLAKIGADTPENEQHFAEILPIGRRVGDPDGRAADARRRRRSGSASAGSSGTSACSAGCACLRLRPAALAWHEEVYVLP